MCVYVGAVCVGDTVGGQCVHLEQLSFSWILERFILCGAVERQYSVLPLTLMASMYAEELYYCGGNIDSIVLLYPVI